MVRPALWPRAVIRVRSVASLLPRLRRQASIPSKRSPPQRWLIMGSRCLLAVNRQCRQASPVQRQSLPRQPTSGSELTGRQTRPSDLLSGQITPSRAILARRRTRLPPRLHPVAARREPIMRRRSAKPFVSTSQVPRDRTRAAAAEAADRRTGGADQEELDPQTDRTRAVATAAATETGAGQGKPGPQAGQVAAGRREAEAHRGADPTTDAIT